MLKPCKQAYKQVRPNSDEIFKGFGFRHLSDATQYYVHPNNQSYKGTTTLCQPIGEAVMLLTDYISGIFSGENIGDILSDDSGNTVCLDITVPRDWLASGVTDAYSYRGYIDSTSMIRIGAYDKNGRLIESSSNSLTECYKLLPVLMLLLARLILTDDGYCSAFLSFAASPDAESFVGLHEDFYQHFKNDEFLIDYRDISFPKSAVNSFSEKYRTINENEKALKQRQENVTIVPFDNGTFSEEYLPLVPDLKEEFVLPKNLASVCNAVVSGDVTAVLLHGPAGTGKTMSCKLICREINMPVMETVNCTENLDEFVLGKYLPDGDRIVFRESYVTAAIRYGGAVIFEEINFARPQYLAFLNSLLDDNGFVRLDSGEIVRRHKNFRFFATMNIGYYGTRELNQALYNRFNAIIELAELYDEAISRMLTARVPECAEHCDKLISVYHKLKAKISAEELDMVISPRNIENWARLAKFEGYIAAAEKTIIPIAKCDRAAEDAIRGMIRLYKWQ
ncbi:MAG: AAA family ATPase [Oscillospiraceae bacterium]|nr:AAA family ATPase [Oscillospiraceae bacterium]